MVKVITIILLLLFLAASYSYSEDPHPLEKIVVTPSRINSASDKNTRSVEVLDEGSLGMSTYVAIQDKIGNLSGVDIRRRGPEGVQSDISIRGTGFEQNIVMIDGIKINDPQTGHFSMDIPLTAVDIDKVEILKGPASSLYGANAFGGVINIITKPPEGKSAMIDAQGGSFDFFSGTASVSYPFATINNRFSLEERRSTGYMPETDFNIFSLSDSATAETFLGIYNFLFGYSKKDFGADSFYSNLFSNEEEHTDTRFFKIDGTAENGCLKIMPKLFLRRHKDQFALDRNRPGWQTNYHTTYVYGGELDFAVESDFMDISYGFELSRDTIDSTSLQAHARTTEGMYVELSPKIIDRLYLNIGMREDRFSDFGWAYLPSISASYKLLEALSVRGLIGRAYRIPTFTDLYYRDSGNIGNPNLNPESSWNYETGLDYNPGAISSSATFFHRDTYDTIDWIRASSRDPWRAINIGLVSTNGFELSLGVMPKAIYRSSPINKLFMNYTALDSYRKHDYLSKYALDYLKQQISSGIEYEVYGFKNSWILNYKKRIGDSGFIVVDTKISKNIIRKKGIEFEAYLDISNIFDINYSEQSDIPMPGRWIKSGACLKF